MRTSFQRALLSCLFAMAVVACGGKDDDDDPASAEDELTKSVCAKTKCEPNKRCVVDHVKCKKAPCPARPVCL